MKKSNFFSNRLTPDEIYRLDRQLRLPGWNQEALKNSSVLIAGIGGLGTEIAKNLAMAGVGRLYLVDMDTIEYTNLNRQLLFSDGNTGEPKAVVAARTLFRINPHSQYVPLFSRLEDVDPAIYETADIYISGLDSVSARRELARRAVHNQKPLVDGGTTTYYGHVYSYIPNQNACLECDPLKERERETLAACTLVGVPRKRIHCLLKGQLFFEANHGRPPNIHELSEMEIVLDYANNLIQEHFPTDEPFGLDEAVSIIDHHEPSIITINAVIASLQSQEALKILHHLHGTKLGEPNAEYTIYNGLIGKFFYFERPPNKNCLLCGEFAPPVERLVVPSSTVCGTLLPLLKQKGYFYSPDDEVMFYRIDKTEMELVDLESTLSELNIRHGETLYCPGLTKSGRDVDIYVKILYPEVTQ